MLWSSLGFFSHDKNFGFFILGQPLVLTHSQYIPIPWTHLKIFINTHENIYENMMICIISLSIYCIHKSCINFFRTIFCMYIIVYIFVKERDITEERKNDVIWIILNFWNSNLTSFSNFLKGCCAMVRLGLLATDYEQSCCF